LIKGWGQCKEAASGMVRLKQTGGEGREAESRMWEKGGTKEAW